MIGAIILGLVAGFIAKALLPGDDPGGFIGTILLGLAGPLIGLLPLHGPVRPRPAFTRRPLRPGDDPGGFIVTILLGLAGSLIGFFLFTELLGIGDSDMF